MKNLKIIFLTNAKLFGEDHLASSRPEEIGDLTTTISSDYYIVLHDV